MTWSFRLVRIFGTDVKVHFTFLILLAVLWLARQQQAGVEAAVETTLLFLSLFTCVVLHEFGHILMARRFGIRTPDVLVLPIGGVARLERIPEEPKQELLIAVAGPVVTAVIAGIFWLWLRATGQPIELWDIEAMGGGLAINLLQLNLILLGFNLVPAFPLDGGRVLRALLSMRLPYVRATRLAATVGQGFAILFGLYALMQGQIFWMLIALFIYFTAGQEASIVATRAAGKGIIVDQMMITQFRTLPVYATLRQAVDLLLEGEQREFPVVDNLGKVEGLLTRDLLTGGLGSRGPDSPVTDAMAKPVPQLPLGLPFEEALNRLRQSGLPALPVVDGGGQLVGLLTLDNIADLILVRQAVTPP